MSAAIDQLRHDHDAILLALRILGRMAEQARHGQLAQADAASFITFIREFADTCHHGKEEGHLFPAMIAAGLPSQGGPVAVMLHEHDEGRELVAAMERASATEFDAAAFARAADAYAEQLTAHIAKENNVLFPMAERIIAPERLDDLDARFNQHEEQVIGHGRHEELHQILRDLKARHLD